MPAQIPMWPAEGILTAIYEIRGFTPSVQFV